MWLLGIVLARERELQMMFHCGKVYINRVKSTKYNALLKLCRLLTCFVPTLLDQTLLLCVRDCAFAARGCEQICFETVALPIRCASNRHMYQSSDLTILNGCVGRGVETRRRGCWYCVSHRRGVHAVSAAQTGTTSFSSASPSFPEICLHLSFPVKSTTCLIAHCCAGIYCRCRYPCPFCMLLLLCLHLLLLLPLHLLMALLLSFHLFLPLVFAPFHLPFALLLLAF